jgi:hypothetical protein
MSDLLRTLGFTRLPLLFSPFESTPSRLAAFPLTNMFTLGIGGRGACWVSSMDAVGNRASSLSLEVSALYPSAFATRASQ